MLLPGFGLRERQKLKLAAVTDCLREAPAGKQVVNRFNRKLMVCPPPWTLTGDGLILVANFPERFVREHGFLAPYQRLAYRGWLGSVMVVNYRTSNVGPYSELLFIPGWFRFGATSGFSISKIYVSTDDSVWNGRRNWGIPKERADFSFAKQEDGSYSTVVSLNGNEFLSLRAKPWGPRIPVTTRLLPGVRIVQMSLNSECTSVETPQNLFLTRPSATGSVRLARLSSLRTDAAYFPDLGQLRPLAVFALENFRMTFPAPELH